MSFLHSRLPLSILRNSGVQYRSTATVRTSTQSIRPFSVSVSARKSVTDAAKDAAKKVDQTVADAAVKGIETGGTFLKSQFRVI